MTEDQALATIGEDVYAWHEPEHFNQAQELEVLPEHPLDIVPGEEVEGLPTEAEEEQDLLAAAEALDDKGAQPPILTDFESVKEAKKRKKSRYARDNEGKVIRKGRNLSGNKPFRTKIYAITSPAPEIALRAAPMQVQLIIKFMAEKHFRGTGGEIVAAAINAGYVKSKIDPPVLFAYYARLMERLGVSHVE